MKNKSENSNKSNSSNAKPNVKKKNWLWELLSSVKLAVIVIFLIAIACILGTFIVQGRSSAEYAARFGEGWGYFLELVEFTNVFYSKWFSVLMIMLCLNLAVCAIKRWRNTILQLGFLATHLSMILIMIGCLIDGWSGEKGAVNMIEGQTVDYFFKFDREQTKFPLDFQVRLDDFELEKHDPRFELISYVKDKDRERKITTKIDYEHSVQSGKYKVKVKKFLSHAELKNEPVNSSNEMTNPAVFTKLYKGNEVHAEGWLMGKKRYWYDYTRGGIRIEYLIANSDDEEKKLVNTGSDSVVSSEGPMLDVILKDRNLQLTLPFKVGEEYRVGNTEYQLHIEEFTKDYGNRNLPADQQTDNNQAAKVIIHGPQGDESRWLFANYPEWDEMHAKKYGDIKLVFEAAGSTKVIENIVKVVQRSDGAENTMYFLKNNEVVNSFAWEVGKEYMIGSTGVRLELAKYFPSFDMRQDVKQNIEGRFNPAIYIEATGAHGTVYEWIFAENAQVWWYPDGNFALLYQEEREMIKDFKSTLTVIENGKEVKTEVIEVNVPLSYKGFDFYQANYDPDNPKFSGIQISSHPGIAVVYAGFIVLCIGITFIFYVKPLIKKIRKNKREKEGSVAA